MSLVILKELEAYTVGTNTEQDLIAKLGLVHDPEKFDSILNELTRTTYIKHRPPHLGIKDLTMIDQEDDNEGIDEKLKNEETYQFTYVGIIVIRNITIVIYPKYIDNIIEDKNNSFSKFRQIIKVISKYKHRRIQELLLTEGSAPEDGNKLAIAIQLIEHFHHYGLYQTNLSLIETDGEGPILWEKTINELPVILSGKFPIYPNIYTENIHLDELNIVRQIQLAILFNISQEFEDTLGILGLYLDVEESSIISDLNDYTFLMDSLDKEFNQQFVTHQIELLHLLKMYLAIENKENSITKIELYGVPKFDKVWEDVCQLVYRNDLDETLASLKDKDVIIPDKYANELDTKLKNAIEKPKWIVDNRDYEGSPLRLDVLSITKDEFHIYDAKYYLIDIIDGKLVHNPGVNDVIKQYLYQQLFAEFITKNDYKENIKNTFIMPGELGDLDEIHFGSVKMDLFPSSTYATLDVIKKDCQKIFAEYLRKN